MATLKRLLAVATAVCLTASLAVIVFAAVTIRLSLAPPQNAEELSLERIKELEKVRIAKCCRNGEQLASTFKCMPRPGFKVTYERVVMRVLLNDTVKHYWTPIILEDNYVNVLYGALYEHFNKGRGRPIIGYEDDENNSDISRILNIGDNGFSPFDFCFDALQGRTRVLLHFQCSYYERCLRKCCRFYQNLRSSQNLAECDDYDSEKTLYRNIRKDYVHFSDSTFQLCKSGSFRVLQKVPYTQDQFHHFAELSRSLVYPENSFVDQETCVDMIKQDDPGDELVLGACERFIGGWRVFWHLSQPLCVVAALLLALALVSVALQSALRSSNHGRALACHAASLLLLNILHVYFRYIARLPKIWEEGRIFVSQTHLRITAYLIYFFIHAANWWLTVLCFNMAKGLRRIRRAPALASAGGRKASGEWGLFALYCSFGWGAPLSLTSLVIYITQKSNNLGEDADKWAYTALAPTLVETKTSFFFIGGALNIGIFNDGSFYFYFLPAGLVLVLNLALFVYIFLLIRRAQKDTEVLRHAEENRTSGAHDSAWMYIRLLLTTGVLEAAVETGTWLNSQNITPSDLLSLDVVRTIVCQYEAPLNIIDVIRAFIILSLTGFSPNMRQRMSKTMGDIVGNWRRLVQFGFAPTTALVRRVRRALWRPEPEPETVDLGVLK